MSYRFGVREADAPPIVAQAETLKSAIANFLDALSNANGLEERYPVSETDLAAVPAMLDQIVAELDPDLIDDFSESGFSRGPSVFKPRCFD